MVAKNKRDINTNSGFRTFYNQKPSDVPDFAKRGAEMSAVTEHGEHGYGSISQYTEKGMRKPFAEIDGQTTEVVQSEDMSPIYVGSIVSQKVN